MPREGVAAVVRLLGEARPCRSSPATARRRPAASTRCRSAPSRSGARTCASSRSGARRSSRRSPSRASSPPSSRERIARLPHQGRARGPLPAVQAQAPHARHHRPRARPRAARRAHPGRSRRRRRRGRGGRRFVDADKEVPTSTAALAGARDICAERRRERRGAQRWCARLTCEDGVIRVAKTKEYRGQGDQVRHLRDFEEPVAHDPSHRFLAIRRGETEGVLRADLELDVAPRRRHREPCAG